MALEKAKEEKNLSIEEVDTQHTGYLLAQDTFYVCYIKRVGRIMSRQYLIPILQ